MAANILEIKIAIRQVFFVIFAVIIGSSFTVGAFQTGQWAWLVAIPLNIIGAVLVVVGGLQRRATGNERGTAISILGGVCIVGSIWAAFMLGNAFPT